MAVESFTPMYLYEYNCSSYNTTSSNHLLKITSDLLNLSCNASNGNRIKLSDCLLNSHELKQVFDSFFNHTEECYSDILSLLSNTKKYYGIFEFINIPSLCENELSYIAKAVHSMIITLGNLSSYSSNFLIFFSNTGVLKEQADRLLSSCKNINIFHHPDAYWYKVVDTLNYITGAKILKIFDSKQFFTLFSNEYDDNRDCILNQPDKIFLQSEALTSLDQYNTASIAPWGWGLAAGAFAGICLLANYLYKNYFTSPQIEYHTTEECSSEAPYLGECQEPEV